MKMLRVLPIVLASLLLVPAAVGQSSSAISLSDVEAAYDALDGLQASFTQTITSDFAGDTTRVNGTVVLSGNRYRVETVEQTIVTNGETTWIYTPADTQVVVNDTEEDASTVTPKTFLTASAERYRITSSTDASRLGQPHVRLEIAARDSTTRFQNGVLWVRSDDRVLTRMKATDRNGSTLDLRLRDVTVNPPLEGDPFTFSPPDDVEVIDLRSTE